MQVRPYEDKDYEQLKALYTRGDLFGGQFDEKRDARELLARKIASDPSAILVAEDAGKIVGTISLVDDGRLAWLFRFAVPHDRPEIAQVLYARARAVFRSRGHLQVLVYSPENNEIMDERYSQLGFVKGGNYTCYWMDIG